MNNRKYIKITSATKYDWYANRVGKYYEVNTKETVPNTGIITVNRWDTLGDKDAPTAVRLSDITFVDRTEFPGYLRHVRVTHAREFNWYKVGEIYTTYGTMDSCNILVNEKGNCKQLHGNGIAHGDYTYID